MPFSGNGGSGGDSGCNTAMSFGIQAFSGRWFMVYGAILINAMSGLAYLFGTYSNELKSTLGYDQSTLNLISFFKDVGTTVGLPSGLLMEVMPPWVVLAFGGVLNFFGYFMIWLAVTGKIAKPAVWQMCLYICIGANSQAFTNTAGLVTCVMNFPESRGALIGLLKGFMGLSGAIVTQIYHAIYDTDSKSLILLIAWLPTLVSFAFLRTIRIMKPFSNSNDVKVFYQLLYMSLTLAAFILLMIVLQLRLHFSHASYVASAFTATALMCLPLYTVFRQELTLWNEKNKHRREAPIITGSSQTHVTASCPTEPAKAKQQLEREADGCFENVFRPPARGEDYTILQTLFSIDMLVLFVAAICGIGGTLTAMDNLGQIGTSLGYSKKRISTFVSLISIWNYLGRVTSGFLSEHLLNKYKLPRPLMLSFVLLLSCLGHLFIAFGITNGLYIASAVIGFCYGALWPLLFSIISELFGLKYYSTLSTLGAVASPVGIYILNVRVTGNLYDKEANRQLAMLGRTRKVGEELNCDGVKCFKLAFQIITVATIFAMLVSLILVARTRKFYQSDIYKKFRTGTEVGQTSADGRVKVYQVDDPQI